MFTNEEIIKLRKDKKYKKTNGFLKNCYLSQRVIKSGIGNLSISVSTSGTVSISIISWLWKLLSRNWFITKEITYCRSRIIEGLLNTESIVSSEKLIKESICIGKLEYNRDVVKIIGNACIEYIGTAEYRVILASHSNIQDKEEQVQAFHNAREELERIFKLADKEFQEDEIKAAMRAYNNISNNEDFANLIKSIYNAMALSMQVVDF